MSFWKWLSGDVAPEMIPKTKEQIESEVAAFVDRHEPDMHAFSKERAVKAIVELLSENRCRLIERPTCDCGHPYFDHLRENATCDLCNCKGWNIRDRMAQQAQPEMPCETQPFSHRCPKCDWMFT